MSQESPIVVKKREVIKSEENSSNASADTILLDTRFQSYLRYYIYEILNAEIVEDIGVNSDDLFQNCNQTSARRDLIKINNMYLYKVAISGIISSLYESEKYYRLRVDDATGSINVTVWKNSIFNDDSLKLLPSTSLNNTTNSSFIELYEILNSIQNRIKDNTINNNIMYEPKLGDLVVIRGQIKCYKQRIDINAQTCTRVQKSNDELIQMMLPSILSGRVYSIPTPTSEIVKKVKTESEQSNESSNASKPNEISLKGNENFLNLVHKKFVNYANFNTEQANAQIEWCSSFNFFNFFRNNCTKEYKFISHKHVLDALKELELRGLVYSCEDEFHYLPLL